MNTDLTPHQRDLLQAANDCDSITSRKLPLRDLNKLAKMGLLEAFTSDYIFGENGYRREVVSFFITDAGKQALGIAQPASLESEAVTL